MRGIPPKRERPGGKPPGDDMNEVEDEEDEEVLFYLRLYALLSFPAHCLVHSFRGDSRFTSGENQDTVQVSKLLGQDSPTE